MDAWWTVEGTQSKRFPYRIRVERGGRTVLCVRAQERWPGPGAQVFCLREQDAAADTPFEPLERVPVASLARLGRRLLIALDRGMRKRCEFLKVERPRADGEGVHEQIFFRTEQALRAHRTSGRVELHPRGDLDVLIDRSERYAWRFPGARTAHRALPVGDYALLVDERPVAVIERKSLVNLLKDVGEIRALHQQMADLATYPRAALVVEARYGDLADPKKAGAWPPAHLLRVVAELAALWPTVPVVFAGNRKLANVWAERWFSAVEAAIRQKSLPAVKEPPSLFEASATGERFETRLRRAVLQTLPDPFPFAALCAALPDASEGRVRRALHALRDEGRVRCEGHGRSARWRRL